MSGIKTGPNNVGKFLSLASLSLSLLDAPKLQAGLLDQSLKNLGVTPVIRKIDKVADAATHPDVAARREIKKAEQDARGATHAANVAIAGSAKGEQLQTFYAQYTKLKGEPTRLAIISDLAGPAGREKVLRAEEFDPKGSAKPTEKQLSKAQKIELISLLYPETTIKSAKDVGAKVAAAVKDEKAPVTASTFDEIKKATGRKDKDVVALTSFGPYADEKGLMANLATLRSRVNPGDSAAIKAYDSLLADLKK